MAGRALRFVVLVLLMSRLSAACSLDHASLDSRWRYPLNRRSLSSKALPSKLRVGSLPDGVSIGSVTYSPPGLLMRAADKHGWWEFRDIDVYSFRGTPFALQGYAHLPTFDKNGRRTGYMLCLLRVLIYDEDGDGKFESVAQLPVTGDPELHLPSWVTKTKRK